MLTSQFSRIVLIVVAVFITGCSSSGNTNNYINNPVTADNSVFELPVGVSDYIDQQPASGMGLLGLFELNIDPVNVTSGLVSKRTSTLTDVLETVDITSFLKLAPCTDCVRISSVELDLDGNVVLNIGIKHPFDVGDPLKPITSRNRADLHVFNIEGIVMSDNDSIIVPGLGQQFADISLVNANGYTGYLDDSIDLIFPTDATVHPYIQHFNDYSEGNFNPAYITGFESVTDPPPSGYLVMAMGSDYDYQDYCFDIDEMNPVSYSFAVGCTYAVSAAGKSERFTPEYRMPQHNKKAASQVWTEITRNELAAGNTSSSADIDIMVVDINHGVPVGNSLDEMYMDSSVGSINIALPGVMNDILSVDISSPSGSGHDPSDPLIFSGTIINTSGGVLGIYKGMVKVTDSYLPGENISPLLNGHDGISRVSPLENPLSGTFQIAEFATYQVFSIEIIGQMPTVLSIVPDTGAVESQIDNAIITGTDFDSGCTAEIEFMPGETIPMTVNWLDATSLELDFDLAGASLGLYDVKVTNPFMSPAVLVDGFEVVEGECPVAPNAAYTYTSTPTTQDWRWAYLDPIVYRNTFAESTIDMDFMHDSNNQLVVNGRDHLNQIGAITPVLYQPGSNPNYYISDVEVMSIDVGMDNRIVYVNFDDSHLAGSTSIYDLIPDRTDVLTGADTEFHVFDTDSMTEVGTGFDIGARIQAIDIDANETIWVFDENNAMHCFEVNGATYTENTSKNFDMDTNGSNMQGILFDFAINFYNEAFYILTNATTQGYLYRVECDGVFNAMIDGNPNPIVDIWVENSNDRADIVIDNFDDTGAIHDGEQDAQILCVANISMSYSPMASKIGIRRIDANLGNSVWYLFEGVSNVGYGAACTAFNGITNEMYTKCGPPYGNQYIVQKIFVPAGEWE